MKIKCTLYSTILLLTFTAGCRATSPTTVTPAVILPYIVKKVEQFEIPMSRIQDSKKCQDARIPDMHTLYAGYCIMIGPHNEVFIDPIPGNEGLFSTQIIYTPILREISLPRYVEYRDEQYWREEDTKAYCCF